MRDLNAGLKYGIGKSGRVIQTAIGLRNLQAFEQYVACTAQAGTTVAANRQACLQFFNRVDTVGDGFSNLGVRYVVANADNHDLTLASYAQIIIRMRMIINKIWLFYDQRRVKMPGNRRQAYSSNLSTLATMLSAGQALAIVCAIAMPPPITST